MSDTPDDLTRTLSARPLGAPVAFGFALSLVLLTTLLYVLWRDYEGKLQAAQLRVAAMALGSDRLLTVEIRNLERALKGIAGDSEELLQRVPDEAPALLQKNIDGVASRHAELLGIVLVDGSGRALTRGKDDPSIVEWARQARNRIGADDLIVGPPIRIGTAREWAIPLAAPLSTIDGSRSGWVLTWLRLSALQDIATGLDVGQQGIANILHRNGTMLARSRDAARFVGRDFSKSELLTVLLPRSPVGIDDLVSPVDGIRRILAYRALKTYPLVVVVGVSRQEILSTWYAFAGVSALVCLLYGLGWMLLVRTLLKANVRQRALMTQLGKSHETLLEAQQIGGLGSWSLDLQTELVEFSPQAQAIYGWTPERPPLTLQSCLAQTHPDDRERLEAEYAQHLATNVFRETRYRIVRPDGSVRSIVARGRIVGGDGQRMMVGTVQDITDLEHVYAQLRETEAQYRLLFEQNPLPFWVFHRETFKILEANEMAIEHYGYSREEFQGMSLADIRPEEDAAEALAVARQGHPEDRRGRIWRHRRKDGRLMNVAVHASDINFRGQPARLVLALDVTERMEAQRRLELSENRFQLVARATSDAVFDWDITSGVSWRSDSFDSLFRYAPGQVPATIEAWRERVHPDDLEGVNASLKAFFESTAREWQTSYRFQRGDGSYAYVLDRGTLQRDAEGKPMRMVGGMVDISRQHQDEAELRLLRRAIESTESGIVIVDARAEDMPLVYVNAAFERITGYSESEALGRNCRFLQADDRAQDGLEAVRAALGSQRDVRTLLRNYRKDGELFYNQLSLSPVRDEDGRLTHFVGSISDVTQRHLHEDKLAYQASHDELTGLLNRGALLTGLQRLLASLGEATVALVQEEPVALLHIEISNFKLINDSFGHEVGDEVLRTIAQRLRAVVGDIDRVSRLGGNEFVAVLAQGVDQAAATEVVTRILAALAQPIEALSTLHYLSLNAGIARYPEHGRTPELLLKHAGLATHEAVRRGHNQLVDYAPAFERSVSDRQHLVSRLHEAMERNEFELFFQPLFSTSPQRPVGLEALIRWRHPERGLVPPAEFIPVCEDSGLIVPLGRWVLREACRHHRLLADAGWGALSIAVNVSAMQFLSGELQHDVPALLREFQVPHGVLELELTESLVMENPESVIEVMRALRQHGVLLSIDDFGTGYSSMSYLHRLPVDKLKIDRSFITDVDSDTHNAAICESILALARSFDLKVIAEGVETQAQFDWLQQRGCEQVQGYLLARPAPFAQMVAALAR